MYKTTKLVRVVTNCKEFLPMKSYDPLVMWSFDFYVLLLDLQFRYGNT